MILFYELYIFHFLPYLQQSQINITSLRIYKNDLATFRVNLNLIFFMKKVLHEFTAQIDNQKIAE